MAWNYQRETGRGSRSSQLPVQSMPVAGMRSTRLAALLDVLHLLAHLLDRDLHLDRDVGQFQR